MHSMSLGNQSLSITLLLSLLLFSCATNTHHHEPLISQDININNNFIIEGKFKIKINNLTDSGYFIVSKINNEVLLKIGKNFLMPEKEFLYDIKDSLIMSEIINLPVKNLKKDLVNKKLQITYVLETILGKLPIIKDNEWKATYPNKFQVKEGNKFPKRVLFSYKSISLDLFLSRIKNK